MNKMELQDTNSEALNGTVWLGQSLLPTYQRLSPSERQDERDIIIGEQVSMGYHVPDGIILWQENKEASKNDNQLVTNCNISRGNSPTSDSPVSGYYNSTSNSLKRRSNETHQTIGELDRKYIRRDGSVVSNGSVQGWSSGQVEELAEHLAADFDGSLSALTANDLATAVASYNMSEALLTLPSQLTVFKQEAPSPENHINNSNLNQVSQRNTESLHPNNDNIVLSAEPDSNHNGSNIAINTATTTRTKTPITSTSTTVHSRNNTNDAENNANHSGMTGRGPSETASSFQFLYANCEDYPNASSAGNHVTSSQQGNEFNEDGRFQYVLAAATSIATKINEETLTYLNQGQSYEIKLKKLGDLSAYRGKILKSTIRICFHERRLQYTEKEQILAWQNARPGERLLEVDVPLSYGMLEIVQSSSSKNNVEFMWDPTKEVGVYIKVNCISTEFTPKKHGGEKGVPFRIQVETLLPGGPRLHAASCQIKVFKLKGADRKHKQDRDKILRRPSIEQEKYQPSYDCTVLSDMPLDLLSPATIIPPNEPNTPTKSDTIVQPVSGNTPEGSSPSSAVNSPVSESSSEDSTTIMPTSSNETFRFAECHPPPKNRNVQEAAAWLRKYFPAHESTFVNYSGIDLLNLTRQEFVQFCGPLDGIRMYNEVTEKAPVPKLVIYCALESDSQPTWKLVRLFERTSDALIEKLSLVFNLPRDRVHSVFFQGPRGIHVLICDDLVSYMEKDSVYLVQILKDSPVGYFKLLLKPYDG